MSLYSTSFELVENVKRKRCHLKAKKPSKRFSVKFSPYKKKKHTPGQVLEGSSPIEKKFCGTTPRDHPDEVADEILFRRMDEMSQRIGYKCQIYCMGLVMIGTVVSGGCFLAYMFSDLKNLF